MSLKVRLLLGSTLPLVFALPAMAQTQITTVTTTPVSTSTAAGGAASDVEIKSAGSITLSDTTGAVAVTVDSNNMLVNDGAITINDSDNAVGVRILPGLAAGYSGEGTISLLEDYTREDDDGDDDLDGPLAIGTGRYGLLVEPGGTLTGDINLEAGSITIEGNNSAGVSIQSVLDGSYRQSASISVVGSNSIGVDLQQNVSGDVRADSAISAVGEGATAMRVLGDVGGEFAINGSLYATGYTNTSVTNYADPDELDEDDVPIAERLDADDLLIGGSGLVVRGNAAYGLLINGAAVGGVDPTDDIKDVVQDFNENRATASIASYGSAPALLIKPLDGSEGRNITLSPVRETVLDTLDDDDDDDLTEVIGVFDYDYGLINRGSIIGNGLNVGVSANAVTIAGSDDGLHTTTIAGGIFNGGTISATAFEADADALVIGAGASTPQLVNIGSISASIYTETTDTATAIRIDQGASVPIVTNGGYIGASVRGYDGDAIAFQDLSGTVATFTNTSRIAAGYIDDDTTDDITSGAGRAIALDLSHSNSGVHVIQQEAADNARMYGEILLGAGDDRFDLLSGQVEGDIDFGSGSDTLNINSAKLYGDATFNGAAATIRLAAAEVEGNLALGSAAAFIGLSGGSIFTGDITGSNVGALTIDASTLNNTAAGTLGLQSLSLTNGSNLGVVINNARIASGAPIYAVSGTAAVSADTTITPIFQDFIADPFTVRILQANALSIPANPSTLLTSEAPFIYDIDLLQTDANALDLSLSVKTADELGLNTRQSGAYAAMLDLFEQDSDVGSAVASLSGGADFRRAWSDLLPGSDAAVMRLLASNATAAFGVTAHRLDLVSGKPNAPGGAWAEEFTVIHNSDPTESSVGIEGAGYGVAAGIDVLSNGVALIGAYGSLEAVRLEEEGRTGAPLSVTHKTLGLYGGWRDHNVSVNGSASIGLAEFTSVRQISIGDFSEKASADWAGQTASAAIRAEYRLPIGWLDIKPYVAADYIGFSQDGYEETAASDDALTIVAGESDASLATASYGLTLGSAFGRTDVYSINPQVSVGYREVLDWKATPAALRFAGGSSGTSFQLDSGVEPESALTAGVGLNVQSEFLNIHLGYDAEIADAYVTHYGSVTLRFAFW